MTLLLTFGGIDVQVSTTSSLSRLLAVTHRRHRADGGEGMPRTVTVRISPPSCSPELALRDVQREIAGHVAAVGGWQAIDAVVTERDGRALVLVGLPGCGKSTIAAHLLGRGWRLLADGVAFVDLARGAVLGHQGLMMFRSGAIPHLPSTFRPTLERSRRFVDDGGELQFYEVDPATAFGAEIWSTEALLDAVVFIDDTSGQKVVRTLGADAAALPVLGGGEIRLGQVPGVRVGVIGKDRSVSTSDRIEHWFDAHVDA